MIDIQSNGSKWAGESPDSISKLLDVLSNYPLRRDILSCGDYIQEKPVWVHSGFNTIDKETGDFIKCYIASGEQPKKGVYHFSGNFYNFSHVFSIYTNDKRVINKLTKAIEDNMKREDFLSQSEPKNPEPYLVIFNNGDKNKKTVRF